MVTSVTPRDMASATNSQSYAEQSLSRTSSRTRRESTSYSAPAGQIEVREDVGVDHDHRRPSRLSASMSFAR